MTTRKIDSELEHQLRSAGDRGEVEAVLRMRAAPAGRKTGAPARSRTAAPASTESAARRLVRRAEHSTGLKVSELHVFRNLGAFVVCAPAALIRALMDLEEVAAAVANRRPVPVPVPKPRKRPPATKRRGRRVGS